MDRHHKAYARVEAPNNFRYVSSTNSLLGNKEHRVSTQIQKKTDLSKEKENQKVYNVDKRIRMPIAEEHDRKVASNYPTFKGMSRVTQYLNPCAVQTVEDIKTRDKRDKSAKHEAKQIYKVSSAITINTRVDSHQSRKPDLKLEPKPEARFQQPKKNSEKRNGIVGQKVKRQLDKQCSPNQFLCDQEIETIQPKSSRNVHLKPSKPAFTKHNIVPQKQGPQQQIQQFQRLQVLVNAQEQANQVLFIGSRETFYTPDPNYIERKQKHFSWFMRAILVEWMMHVSFEYRLKRQTFHLATSLTDLFFSKAVHVPKTELQLVGAAAMYLAAKIEEREPLSVVKFAASTSGKYQPKMILNMESKIVKTMKWELNPPTLSMWANKIMQQWDLFMEQSDYTRNHPLISQGPSLFFKKFDQSSYSYFRQVMQILDCCILDIQSCQYKPKPLVCSIIYLVLKRVYQSIPVKDIVNEYPRRSDYLLDPENPLNDVFRAFVEYTFGFLLLDLLPTVQYCSTFFSLQLSYETQTISNDELGQCNLQDYSSFQTYNCNSLSVIKRRHRGIQDLYSQ